jgi:hypothetical protein
MLIVFLNARRISAHSCLKTFARIGRSIQLIRPQSSLARSVKKYTDFTSVNQAQTSHMLKDAARDVQYDKKIENVQAVELAVAVVNFTRSVGERHRAGG